MQYIYGLSKSGISLAKYLNKRNENFYCWDDDINARKLIKKILNNIQLVNPKKNNLDKFDKIYI